MEPNSSLSWSDVSALIIGLLGGLALFLYGMGQMTNALKTAAGPGMKSLLARMTTSTIKGTLAGTIVTGVIQASSVTAILVIGFVSAGLMTLPQSIGVIMGANIGTTVTAQIIAFKITRYGLLMIAAGFGLSLFRNERLRHQGGVLLGLGMIFFGMDLMSTATAPLRTYEPFLAMMRHMSNPLPAILLGAVCATMIQSSSATIGIIIVLASHGFITLEAGIALSFGANIGTCTTALMASLGKRSEALQVALVHVLFNVIGVILWLGFIPQLAAIARWISPSHSDLTGMARLAAETPRQIANAHTLFKVSTTLLLLGFTKPLAALVRRIAPVGLWSGPEPVRPRYLDEIYLTTPAIGLDRVRMELGHLGERTVTLLREAPQVVAYGTRSQLDALSRRNEDIDDLHREILAYLSRLYQQVLTVAESEQVHDYLASANYIETIGNMVESELIEVGRDRIRSGLQLDAAVQDVSGALVAKVTWTVDRAVEALVRSDRKMAREVVSAKAEINLLATAIQGRLVDLLDADDPDSVETFRIRSQVVEYLKRVYYIAKRIAKLTADRGVIQTKEVIARPRRNPRNPATARRRAARKDPGSAEPRSP